MTPSQQAKAAGLRSLRQVSQLTNTPESTLYDMARDNPQRFMALVLGAAQLQDSNTQLQK